MIPFSPPRIDQKIIDEVAASLRSGWITTGPKTKKLEKELAKYVGISDVICVNSATSGMELMLRWFGVQEGDEVIVPAYTYCATANAVLHCGGKPVMVDTGKDFNVDVKEICKAVTSKTKVIIPVDIGGLPCDYDAINKLIEQKDIKDKFQPENEVQRKLGRILVLSDAAHSLGAVYNGRKTGCLSDVTVFSFHAVKNLTTAEGGAVCLNLPAAFNNTDIYNYLCIKSLHGQTKDAITKDKLGNWEYDVIEAGYKYNMPDVLAAIGLVELSRYDSDTLKKRKAIVMQYNEAFSGFEWAETHLWQDDNRTSSFHLFLLRIKNINESQRNEIIEHIFNEGVSVNVHFKPLPLLSLYKNLGYKMGDYPQAFDNYSREISLPVYYDLTSKLVAQVINAVEKAVRKVLC